MDRARITAKLHRQQRADPANLQIAHDLGVLGFWSAQDPAADAAASQPWQQVIANLAMVLGSDEFWEGWTAKRGRTYGETISDDSREAARQLIAARLLNALGECDRLRSSSLVLAFRLETKAISLLRQTKGLAPSDDGESHIFCGPLMVQQLGLEAEVGQLARDLPDSRGELSGFLALLRTLAGGEESTTRDSLDGQTRRRLMNCFSELGPAFISLDQGEPREALRMLANSRCPKCGTGPSRRPRSVAGDVTLPRVCAGDCPHFAERDPAYAMLPDRGEVLFHHAVELAAEAHMALAEQRIRVEPPDSLAVVRRWQDALNLAATIGSRDQFQDMLINMAVGRATALERERRLDDAISLLEETQQLGEHDLLTGKVAELLTDRGVKAGNDQRWHDALRDLRRSLEISPHVTRTRNNLVTALRGAAAEHFHADRKEQARPLLEEAIQVLEEGLEGDGGNTEWQRELFETRMELAAVGGRQANGGLDDVLRTLRTLVEGPDETREGAALTTGGTREHNAIELAERGRYKARQEDYPAAIADLEEALSLAPEETRVRQDLVDVMEKHADALIAQGKRDEGLAVARRGLIYVPDHSGLQATIRVAQFMGGIDVELGSGLLDRLRSRAEGAPAFKTGPANPAAARAARACLDSADLKYQQPGDNHYVVPFRTDERGRVMVQLRVAEDLAVVSAPIAFGSLDETDVLYSFLRATHTADICKSCRDSHGKLHLVAEAPAALLTAASLEGLIRDAVAIVEVPDQEMLPAEKLMAHVARIKAARALRARLETGSSRGGLLGLLRRRSDARGAAQQVPALCRKLEVECRQLREGRFHLKLGFMELDVVAICSGESVSFLASMGGMRPARGHTRFYRRLAEMNAEMDVCKLALDSDDDPTFMYELPALDAVAFRQMVERMERYVLRHGMELMSLA